MKLSIIIPVYNEQNTVVELVKKVLHEVEKLNKIISSYEIIIVDDGSTDLSADKLAVSFKDHSHIKLLFQKKNCGKGKSLQIGIENSTGEILLIQDADHEYDPGDYHILLKPFIENDADVVYGSRFKGVINRVLYFWHYLGNLFLTLLSNMFTDLNLTDMETCYKVFKGDLVRDMKLESHRFGIEPEFTAKISKLKNLRIYEVPISYDGRTYSEGKKIGWKDGVSALYSIIKFNLFRSYNNSYKTDQKELQKKLSKLNNR